MPDGVVQWFDPASGQASIVRGGRVYAARSADLEPVARHPGAHVHFDISRADGAERAVNVTLRAGTRVSRRQRQFGTLAGARRPDTKGSAPFARPHPERGRALATQPLAVARAWVERLRAKDLDGALALYTSDAVIHVAGNGDGDHDLTGRAHIGAYLEASPLFGADREPDVRGEDDSVLVRWHGTRSRATVDVRSLVRHGLVVEQWIGPARAGARAVARPEPLSVVTQGAVDDGDVEYALDRTRAVLRHIDESVLFGRLKLVRAADPAREKPAVAHIALDVNGDLVRAHVAAHTMREAADLLQRHLTDKLAHRAEHRGDVRTRGPRSTPGEWRHGDQPAARPGFFDRPPEERSLVRHKMFVIDELTPDEAAFDMHQLDHTFHLFRDLATGEDAVLERVADGTHRLTRLRNASASADPAPAAIALSVSDVTPPEIDVDTAIERLDASSERFVFFADVETGRGAVLYRRYDGHYGLITAV